MTPLHKSRYPSLTAAPDVIHMDTAAAFPLHQEVIAGVQQLLSSTTATYGKAAYDWSTDVTEEYKKAKQTIARFINAEQDELFFVTSASDGLRQFTDLFSAKYNDTVVYSPEDHNSLTRLLGNQRVLAHLTYGQSGMYDLSDVEGSDARTLIYATNVHPLYGGDNVTQPLTELYPNSCMIIDASQSIGRTTVDVKALGCDALVFSSQKVGGIAGAGVLYIRKQHHRLLTQSIEPNTVPLPSIVSMRYAIDVIEKCGIHTIDMHLTKITEYFIHTALDRLNTIVFTKGPAQSEYSCSGNGIVSFKIDGYSSVDVAMILNEHHINVRAADHCVDADSVDRDVVRVSFHGYTEHTDIDALIDVLATL